MASVGDKVRVLSNKGDQPPRDGVVTAVSGALLRITWSTGEETSLIPGPGAVTVVGRVRTPVKKPSKASGAKRKAAVTPKRPKATGR